MGGAEAEGEAVDVDPGPLGGEEVAGLVHEDQHAEDDDQRQHGDQHDGLTASRRSASHGPSDRRLAHGLHARWPGPG